jgi:hypothetical protein
MKHIGNLLLIMLILSLIVAAGGCGPKFELSSLEVSPEVCLAGETVTVSATLNYSGGAQSEYTAELLLDGTVERTQTLTVEPESSQSLSFTLNKNTPGKYVVKIGELTASLIVLEASNFNLSPSEVEIDQPVTVSADLRNTADTQATVNCCLLCQGTEAATKDVTLAGGAESEVTFTLSRSNPGTYEVKLGNLSGSFKVLKPAEFEVASLGILPNPARVGEEAAVTTIIENVGDIAGTYAADLAVDGEVYETVEVALAGGATETATFSLSKDLPGSYNIQFGGQEAILRVWQPPPTGTFFVYHRQGSARLEVTNRFSDLDIVAVIAKADEPLTPVTAFYVQAGDIYEFKFVGHGLHVLYFTIGEEWDDDTYKFLTRATYHRWEEELMFSSLKERKTTWYFRLGPDLPSWQIPESSFPPLK